VTDDERAELETLRAEARLFNDALYASVRDYQILEKKLKDERAVWEALRDFSKAFNL
jgi:hypothetical protein